MSFEPDIVPPEESAHSAAVQKLEEMLERVKGDSEVVGVMVVLEHRGAKGDYLAQTAPASVRSRLGGLEELRGQLLAQLFQGG